MGQKTNSFLYAPTVLKDENSVEIAPYSHIPSSL